MTETVLSVWLTVIAIFVVGSIATATGLRPTVNCVVRLLVCKFNNDAVFPSEFTVTAEFVSGFTALATAPVSSVIVLTV